MQKEKFRGGNVAKVGNHCLLLGGKQADNLENFYAALTGFVYYSLSKLAALTSVEIGLVLG